MASHGAYFPESWCRLSFPRKSTSALRAFSAALSVVPEVFVNVLLLAQLRKNKPLINNKVNIFFIWLGFNYYLVLINIEVTITNIIYIE